MTGKDADVEVEVDGQIRRPTLRNRGNVLTTSDRSDPNLIAVNMSDRPYDFYRIADFRLMNRSLYRFISQLTTDT